MFPFPQSLVDIPPIFHSLKFGGPFLKCQICTGDLLHEGQGYMIEKVFRGSETIIEIATCLPCSLAVQGEMSEESTLTMQREFHGKVDWSSRMEWLEEESSEINPEKWLDHCLISGRPRSEITNFQIGGLFFGDKMAISALPYLISAKAVEEIGEKLSEQTRGYMRDFIGDQFGMPPEFCQPDSPLPMLM